MAQIGTLKIDTGDGVTEVPVYEIGDSSYGVYEKLRINTPDGIGFIPTVEEFGNIKELKIYDGEKSLQFHDFYGQSTTVEDFEDDPSDFSTTDEWSDTGDYSAKIGGTEDTRQIREIDESDPINREYNVVFHTDSFEYNDKLSLHLLAYEEVYNGGGALVTAKIEYTLGETKIYRWSVSGSGPDETLVKTIDSSIADGLILLNGGTINKKKPLVKVKEKSNHILDILTPYDGYISVDMGRKYEGVGFGFEIERGSGSEPIYADTFSHIIND